MSSEEQYKHIEDKITEAANAADYAFTEASWKKMEALLDKEKNKRRPFFWIFTSLLLGILLIGGGIIYQAGYKNQPSKNTTVQTDRKINDNRLQPSLNKPDDRLPGQQPDLNRINTDAPNSAAGKGKTNIETDLNTGTQTANANTGKLKNSKPPLTAAFNPIIIPGLTNSRIKSTVAKKYAAADLYNAVNKYTYTYKAKSSIKITAPGLENAQENVENKTGLSTDNDIADIKKAKADSLKSVIAKSEKTNKTDTAAKKTTITSNKESKKDKKEKNTRGFYLLAAAGPEVNSVKLFSYKNSSISPRYGLGVGYQFNRRLSVQTGFYAGPKKYIAGPDDYNVKAGSYLSSVKIIKVNANCMVYEIPVTVQYNWLIKPKANYYAAVGLSSYIMKKEKYDYTFLANNVQYNYPYDYTRNSHLLSSLQLSLGIEKQIGRKLSVQAAPVVSLPLQGVGEGSVKIFTTGLQVGLKYLPFGKQ